MLYKNSSGNAKDPIDGFYEVLLLVWESISRQYDVLTELPDSRTLFQDVDLRDPCEAAETVVRNMLTDVTQLVDRFSPWYTMPARSFGLFSYRDIISHKTEWRLAPEALEKWSTQIEMLAAEFDQKSGLIDAIVLISELDILDDSPWDTVVAKCECEPPREISVPRSFLTESSIVCNDCKQKFEIIKI